MIGEKDSNRERNIVSQTDRETDRPTERQTLKTGRQIKKKRRQR